MSKLLVVVDMQNDFITGSLGSEMAVKIVPAVIDKIKTYIGNKDQVIFTLDTHKNDYLETQEGQKLPIEHCIKDSYGHEICDEIKKIKGLEKCLGFEKNTFGSKDLVLELENKHYQEIEIIGLCSDICVISNAMLIKAFCPETKIRVDAQCCAGVTEKSHNEALNAMQVCQIDIINR